MSGSSDGLKLLKKRGKTAVKRDSALADQRAQSAQELELKLELTDGDLRELRSHPLLRELTVGHVATRLLRSIYFDTDDDRLRAAGISLRVRRVSGKWIQTVKRGTSVTGGISNPLETEAAVRGPQPDLSIIDDPILRQQITGAINKAPLVPVFETRVRRTTRHLESPGRGAVELALDKGEIRCPRGSQTLSEAELELISGDPGFLLDLGERLLADIPLVLSQLSKAERGYRHARGTAPPLKPKKGERPVLSPKDTIESAFRKIVGAAVDQALHNWRVVLEADDPEGPHQLRVGLRRLRSALQAFRPTIDGPHVRQIATDARDLARRVGELRDADVMVDDICQSVPVTETDEGDRAALIRHLEVHRKRIREDVRAELKHPRWSTFQIELALFTKAARWRDESASAKKLSKRVTKHGHKALDKVWRKVCKHGRHIKALDIEERHAMRKDLKTLRYSVEFFMPLYPGKAAEKFVNRLKALQDVFGYLNDLAVAERLKALCAEERNPNEGPACRRAVDQVLAWHASRADNTWRDAQKRWKQLERTTPFWQ